MIHIFDLIPGASRQNEATICQTKTSVQQIAVSRAGTIQDQYIVFIDSNRDVFCTSLKTDTSFEIFKIGSLNLRSLKIAKFVFYTRNNLIFRNSSCVGNVG